MGREASEEQTNVSFQARSPRRRRIARRHASERVRRQGVRRGGERARVVGKERHGGRRGELFDELPGLLQARRAVLLRFRAPAGFRADSRRRRGGKFRAIRNFQSDRHHGDNGGLQAKLLPRDHRFLRAARFYHPGRARVRETRAKLARR